MKTRICDIAEVQIGYQHRDKIGAAEVGSHQIIQPKDVVEPGDRFSESFEPAAGIWTGSLYMVSPKGDPDRYLVGPGDVLFTARGSRNFAIPIDARSVRPPVRDWGKVIAGSYFFILRPRVERVLPGYLAWVINQSLVQRQLDDAAHGSHMKLIPKKMFEEVEIDLPSMAVQETIVKVNVLSERERRLSSLIQSKRAELVRVASLTAAQQS
jgi:hypothetical protein